MSTLLVALRPGTLNEEQLTRVKDAATDMEVVVTREREEIERTLPDLRVAFGMFPRDLIEHAPRLEWYQQWGAGADWLLDLPAAAERDFVLTNAAGVHAVPISEHVLAFLLAFARGFPQALRAQAEARWRPLRQAELSELEGKTLLLVGAGRIGSRIATLADAFGMRVIAIRRDPSRRVPGTSSVHPPGELDDLLPKADFVVLTVPHTAETSGMLGARQFAAMKKTAYVINIGRGGTVREPDLVEALRAGDIAGAGLDVFEEEPLPGDSPLWSLENVIVTAHYSGATPRYVGRILEIFLDNLARFQAGQEMNNVVDKRLGY